MLARRQSCPSQAAVLSKFRNALFQFAVRLIVALALRGYASQSIAAMNQLTRAFEAHGAGRSLFVYEGPPFLYTMTAQPFPPPLAFPAHLYHGIEKDVSHLSTRAEVERVLAGHPGVVVMTREPRDGPINAETYALVSAYVEANCRLVDEVEAPERLRADTVLVWGECR